METDIWYETLATLPIRCGGILRTAGEDIRKVLLPRGLNGYLRSANMVGCKRYAEIPGMGP